MEQKRRRGDVKKQEKLKPNSNSKNNPSSNEQNSGNKKINLKSLKYFIPLIVIVLSGMNFKSVIPVAQMTVSIALTTIFVISFGCSYIGAFKTGKVKKFFATFLNVLLMLIFIVISVFTIQIKSGLNDMTTNDVKPNKVNINRDSFNVLISGTDTRSDEIDKPSRSDVIMVATINPKDNKVLFTSLPRDTYYPLTCSGMPDKLTHASADSMECLQSTVESILDIEINYYIKANFYAVIDLIDAVGGITVDVDTAFCGQDENDVKNAYCFTPGPSDLNGSQALSYARERKSFSDGDYTRAMHQQQVMNAFILKVLSNPTSFDNLIAISSQSVRTNMSSSELLNLMNSFSSFESEGYVVSGTGAMVDIPQQGLYGTSVQMLNDASVAEAQNKINEYK